MVSRIAVIVLITDLENAPKKQIPIKVQSGVAKRSLHDLSTGKS